MDTFDRILKLLEISDKKQADLCNYINVHKQVFTDWKSGRNKSYMKRINEIATFFDVSADFLLGNTDEKNTPHQLRHAYATLLFEAGIDEKDAQELLGHSNIAITKDIYTHISKSRKTETLNILNNYMKKNDDANN